MKEDFLLDTCVLSEGAKERITENIERWLTVTPEASRYVSVISLAEIQYGILRMPEGKRRESYAEWYDNILRPQFAARVLPLDEPAALVWAQLRVSYPNARIADAQIAATALVHGLTIVTRNVKDFAFQGLKVFNPWRN